MGQLVFDRDLEKKRAQVSKMRNQNFKKKGQFLGIWQLKREEQRKRKLNKKIEKINWYYEFNNEEGLELLWNQVQGKNSDVEVKIEEDGQYIKTIYLDPDFEGYKIKEEKDKKD